MNKPEHFGSLLIPVWEKPSTKEHPRTALRRYKNSGIRPNDFWLGFLIIFYFQKNLILDAWFIVF